MTAPASTLSVAKLNKRYKSRIVVHDVSLSVGSGEVIGLLGPNGAGKTTCFYMIVGLVATDGGSIELDGDDHAAARKRLSEACERLLANTIVENYAIEIA